MVAIKNKSEKLRFLIVGSTNTLIDFGLLFVLRSLGIPTLPANITSSTLAFVFSFFANKSYTFQGGSDNIKREILLFVVVTLVGLWVLQSIVLWIFVPLFTSLVGESTLATFLAKLLATAVTLVWNYTLYSRIVFTGGDRRT